MPKAIPSLEQRHVCQKTRVGSTKVMRTRSGSMVISHTTREKRSLGSIVANSGQTRTKQHLLNRYLPLKAAYHVLGFTNTFKWPTHLMGTWPAVGDARPNATEGWHCTRQRFSHNKALHDDYMATRVERRRPGHSSTVPWTRISLFFMASTTAHTYEKKKHQVTAKVVTGFVYGSTAAPI